MMMIVMYLKSIKRW